MSWAQPFPRTWMLRPSADILEDPMGFRQPAAVLYLNERFGEVAVMYKEVRCISPGSRSVPERDRDGLREDAGVRVEETCEGDEVPFQ